tara:strand:+ start:436 stop:813 length:378 start_codon:yes stop_codon:yes gene_type:complete
MELAMAKILVVDDSGTSRAELMSSIQSNHMILEACDGVAGVELYKANQDIDLIITDLNMPAMDGMTMLKEIGKLSSRKPSAIVVTTETDTSLREVGKEAGVRVWIVKPFNPDSISDVVEKILSGS